VLGPSSKGTYVTDANGLAYASVTDKHAETVTVTGTFTWDGASEPAGHADVTFTPAGPSVGPFDCDPSQESTNLSAFPTEVLINQTSTLRAYVTDKYCNPIDGIPVTFSNTGSAVLTSAVAETDPGVATVGMTDSVAEIVDAYATIVIDGVATPLPDNPPWGVTVKFDGIYVQTGGVLASSASSTTSGGATSGLSGVWVGIAAWRRKEDAT